jgi:hypothetical protein
MMHISWPTNSFVWGIGSFENNEIKWINPFKQFHEPLNPTVEIVGNGKIMMWLI